MTYPDDSKPIEKTTPAQVLAIKTPWSLQVLVAVRPIPQGIKLKDVNEKVWKPGFEQLVGVTAKMKENKEITLSDGTKAYYSEMNWIDKRGGETHITTMLVSVYKNGKWIAVVAYPFDNYMPAKKIVIVFRFK